MKEKETGTFNPRKFKYGLFAESIVSKKFHYKPKNKKESVRYENMVDIQDKNTFSLDTTVDISNN